jgi:hypothetical protein
MKKNGGFVEVPYFVGVPDRATEPFERLAPGRFIGQVAKNVHRAI